MFPNILFRNFASVLMYDIGLCVTLSDLSISVMHYKCKNIIMLYIMKTVGKFSLIFNALEQFMEHWNHLVKLA